MATPSAASGWGNSAPGGPRAPVPSRRPPVWPAYAAAAWAFLFAAISAYWAAGGRDGAETIGPAIADHARTAGWVAFLWATAALKAAIGVLALALVRPWGAVAPRRLRHAAAWAAVAVMAGYEGGASWVQHALMVAGVVRIPAGLGETAARWHLLLWDPWWLLGGLLLGTAAWLDRGQTRRSAPRPRGER